MGARLIHAAVVGLSLLAGSLTPVRAQVELPGASFLTPFPTGDVHKVLLVGDDLAEGLHYGLLDAFSGDTRVDIVKRPQTLSGFTRNDFSDKVSSLEDALAREAPSVAVVMLGAWDRNPFRLQNGRRVAIGSQEWRAEYASRVDLVLKTLKKRNVSVYWVGLPVVRRPDMDEDVKMMNEILRERAYINGQKFIDSYAGFVDENGGFSAYGPDQTGKMRLLREGDGVYLTSAGNRKLAFFVEREFKRDLTQAKAERSIPLAGSEAEQSKIHPNHVAAAAAPVAGASPSPGVMPDNVANSGAAPPPRPSPASPPADWQASTVRAAPQPAEPPPAADQKADNGRISLKLVTQSGREETVALDIVRPAIPASVVALVTRRESPDKPTQMGEQLVDQITGGLTVMSSVTPSSTVSASGGVRRLSPTQSPYYRVLMKGERLTPRKGRADDFTWPRPDGAVTKAAAPAAAPAGTLDTANSALAGGQPVPQRQ